MMDDHTQALWIDYLANHLSHGAPDMVYYDWAFEILDGILNNSWWD